MSDENETPPMEMPIPNSIQQLFAEGVIEQMDRSCALARQNQLNKNNQDPRLKALETAWKTMDKFSKRELGEPSQPVMPTQPLVSAQIAPGQRAEVVGPATIYGGNVQVESGSAPGEDKQE